MTEALRGWDFIGKPINLNELQLTCRNGIETGRLRKEVNQMRRDLAREFNFDQIKRDSLRQAYRNRYTTIPAMMPKMMPYSTNP